MRRGPWGGSPRLAARTAAEFGPELSSPGGRHPARRLRYRGREKTASSRPSGRTVQIPIGRRMGRNASHPDHLQGPGGLACPAPWNGGQKWPFNPAVHSVKLDCLVARRMIGRGSVLIAEPARVADNLAFTGLAVRESSATNGYRGALP